MARLRQTMRQRIQSLTRTVRFGERRVSYCKAQVIPETVANLKEVLHEVERIWRSELGSSIWEELGDCPQARLFFCGRVHLIVLPPNREMVAVRLPVPPGYLDRIKPQLIDAIEPYESDPER